MRPENTSEAPATLPDGLFTQSPGRHQAMILGSPHHPAEQRAKTLSSQAPTAAAALSGKQSVPQSAISTREQGFPLAEDQQRSLQPRFNLDFANIRIHTTPAAEQAAAAVQARAFSIGSHLVFGRGQYAPYTPAGNHLLMHEIAHIADRSGAPGQTPILRRQMVAGPAVPATAAQVADPGIAQKGSLDRSPLELLAWLRDLLQPGSSPSRNTDDPLLFRPVAQLPRELAQMGLFGPVMREVIAIGLLPDVPLDYSQRTALQVRWFLASNQAPGAFFYLNGLSMIFMIDVMRLLPAAIRQQLAGIFGEGTPDRATVEKNFGVDSFTRFQTALSAVLGTSAPTTISQVPGDQQQEAQGFRDLPNWLNVLPRAQRDKKKKQGIKPNADPRTAKTTPLVVPDEFTTLPGTAQPAEVQAIIEFIRLTRQRLTDRIASKEHSATGFSHGGSLLKDARPSALPPLDATSKTRTQEVNEALFKELGSEGSNASVNTADGALLTLGKGLANGPSLTSFMLKLFKSDPAFEPAFSAAGVTLAPDPLAPVEPVKKGQKPSSPAVKWFAVNTEQAVVEEGDQALQLIRLDPRLQSIYIGLAESDEHKQNVADAQWTTIMAGSALKFNETVRQKWPLETIRGCAHFVHWGARASWSVFQDNPILQADPSYRNALHVMIDHLIANSGYVVPISSEKNIRMVKFKGNDGTNPSATMMNFADKFAISSGIVVPVATNDVPNSIYFDFFHADAIRDEKKKQYLKLT